MKQLTCEMCGSTDLLKQDGVFVCQSCGTKYSIEDAKRMMVEGTVEVAGTVKVDSTDKIANYLVMANNAYDASNQKEAENYCNKIIEIDPNHSEAWFLKGKAAGWQSTLANIRVEESVNCFAKAIENASEERLEAMKKEAADEIVSLSLALVQLCCNNYSKNASEKNANAIKTNCVKVQLYTLQLLAKCGVKPTDFKAQIAKKINYAVVAAYNNDISKDYVPSDHPSKYAWNRYTEQMWAAIDLLKYANDLSDDDPQEDKTRYENMIFFLDKVKNSCAYKIGSGSTWIPDPQNSYGTEQKEKIIDLMMEYHQKIKEIDPDHVIPERPKATTGGCYVATAVYGSYDCPQVWTLRRYRDYTLAETWYGRAFIHTYYAISPTLVKWFGHTDWFKKVWKGNLDRMVAKLQSEGVENTPYQDRAW